MLFCGPTARQKVELAKRRNLSHLAGVHDRWCHQGPARRCSRRGSRRRAPAPCACACAWVVVAVVGVVVADVVDVGVVVVVVEG